MVARVVIPGLCDPAMRSVIEGANEYRSLVSRLSKADRSRLDLQDYFETMCHLLGIDPGRQSIAALTAATFGIEGVRYRADPVHLRADLDHAILFDHHSLALDEKECDAYIQSINEHFEEDGIRIIKGDAEHWFLWTEDDIDLETTALPEVVSRNVNRSNPVGKDAPKIRSFLSELQMLLFDHEVNQARSERGHLPVNSLWIWGEGEQYDGRSMTEVSNDWIVSDDRLTRAMAQHHAIRHSDRGEIESGDLLRSDSAILVLDDLRVACEYGDAELWSRRLERLWDEVLEALLGSRYPVDVYPCNGCVYRLRPRDRWRFWRRTDLGYLFCQ